jgi:7-carboxy-7-deazaguanine synthase
MTEAPDYKDTIWRTHYALNDIYLAVQGEGVQTGVPMIIVRLQGCGVGCTWCDTKETWDKDEPNRRETIPDILGTNGLWGYFDGEQIAKYIYESYNWGEGWNPKNKQQGLRWVLVTGGEPAEQNLTHLVHELHDYGYKVALETSGTAAGHLGAGFDWVCVSPKLNNPNGKPIIEAAVTIADEIKMVVGRESDIEALDQLLKIMPDATEPSWQVCLQPLSQNKKATELCVKTVQARGWRLSLQMHKYLGAR